MGREEITLIDSTLTTDFRKKKGKQREAFDASFFRGKV